MGHNYSFYRRKQSAACFNDQKEKIVNKKKCQCTPDDYICDKHFELKDNQCHRTVAYDMSKASECVNNQITVSQGYRKIPGNECEGGVNLDPIVVSCEDNGRLAKGLLVLILFGLLGFVIQEKFGVY